MKKVSTTEFRIQCCQLMKEVAESHEKLIITHHGKPYVTIQPHEKKSHLSKHEVLERFKNRKPFLKLSSNQIKEIAREGLE